ncbi:MAG TPA: iron-sulfur cluster assembly protein [Methylomirabilota bacterium]|jgi:metal-sulfur cluster biosynthetic enzyme|nr:iron-sulfur cluster assembly protein [Methylomirabilota bacterium]
MTVSREQVTEALREVFDPELAMSVVDLGLIYGIGIDAGRVRVLMTLTTQGCPLHDSMAEWVRQAVGRVPGVVDVAVALTFEPPWTPDRIGQGARL